ncbi:Hypothetical predicted protein [Paramuricea clavata]|uniref:Uncharacterized protein n=1 Tax=Paramuricea clavata TaxID=317549 RepID=A0A6S7GY98_PARCT|nr:Hypothetical predicted protein [Paramuricea clavata]
MAENLQELQASRAGYQAHLTQTIKKATNIATKEDPLTDSDITSLKRIVDQLARKRSILEELDEKIVGMIEDPKELEKEIFQTEDIKEEIDETAAQISNTIEHFLSTKLSPTIATVSTGQLHCDANILLDEGAQWSFITTDLANQLGVMSSQTEEIALSAYGAQTSARRHLPLATVYIITRTGQQIPLQVLVVEEIATPLQIPPRQHINDMPHLKNLTLAHPITAQEDFRISLLIGANHYWDIVEDEVTRGQGPTAVASKLGYLLSGPLPTPSRPSNTFVNLLQSDPPKEQNLI